MNPILNLTMMDGRAIMIGIYAIKMIEETTYTPDIDKKDMPKAAKDSSPAPATTQPVAPPSKDAPVAPVICSTITFHDNKTMVVKEAMSAISGMSGPVAHSV